MLSMHTFIDCSSGGDLKQLIVLFGRLEPALCASHLDIFMRTPEERVACCCSFEICVFTEQAEQQ